MASNPVIITKAGVAQLYYHAYTLQGHVLIVGVDQLRRPVLELTDYPHDRETGEIKARTRKVALSMTPDQYGKVPYVEPQGDLAPFPAERIRELEHLSDWERMILTNIAEGCCA